MANATSPRLIQEDGPRYLKWALACLPLLSVILMLFALNQLGIAEDSGSGYARLTVLALAAYGVSYAVFRMAIEKGAPLAAVGRESALVLSLGSILLVGLAFFMSTMPGLVIGEVEQRRLQAFVAQTVDYSNQRSAYADRNLRIVPVVGSIVADLTAKAECERTESCVSLSQTTGLGSTARTLDTVLARARSIKALADAGVAEREEVLQERNAILAEMEAALADDTLEVGAKRARLRKLAGDLGLVLNGLDEAIPTSGFAAYANELRAGVGIPGKQAVAERISAFMAGYAASIDEVLNGGLARSAGGDDEAIERPVFPGRAGVPQALGQMVTFAPLALLTFTVDVLFPVALWLYTYWTILYRRYTADPRGEVKHKTPSVFDDLTATSVTGLPTEPKAQSKAHSKAQSKSSVKRGKGTRSGGTAQAKGSTSSARNSARKTTAKPTRGSANNRSSRFNPFNGKGGGR